MRRRRRSGFPGELLQARAHEGGSSPARPPNQRERGGDQEEGDRDRGEGRHRRQDRPAARTDRAMSPRIDWHGSAGAPSRSRTPGKPAATCLGEELGPPFRRGRGGRVLHAPRRPGAPPAAGSGEVADHPEASSNVLALAELVGPVDATARWRSKAVLGQWLALEPRPAVPAWAGVGGGRDQPANGNDTVMRAPVARAAAAVEKPAVVERSRRVPRAPPTRASVRLRVQEAAEPRAACASRGGPARAGRRAPARATLARGGRGRRRVRGAAAGEERDRAEGAETVFHDGSVQRKVTQRARELRPSSSPRRRARWGETLGRSRYFRPTFLRTSGVRSVFCQ